MSISSISGSTTLSSYTDNVSNNSLGEQDFLTLLVAQLENQDPLDPQDNTEFIAQMAQFSSLEQQIATNDKLDTLLSTNQAIGQLSAFNLLGQTVVTQQDGFTLGDEAVELGFNLEQSAETVTLAIFDADGSVVATLDVDDVPAGTAFVSWNGLDGDGNALPAGEYSCLATAIYSSDSSEYLTTLQRAEVTGIDTSDGARLETGQGAYDLSSVIAVKAG